MKLWTVECLSSTRVHEGTMTHACGAADAGAAVLMSNVHLSSDMFTKTVLSACKQDTAHQGSMSERIHHGVTWIILMMSLLPFWALNTVVPLLSTQCQKALGFHQKYINLCSEDEHKKEHEGE